MAEIAYLSVLMREAGVSHSKVVVTIVDGTDLEIVVNNNLLMEAEVPHRARMQVECYGESDGIMNRGKASIELPTPHISHGSRVTVQSKFIERPNPSKPYVAYDTRSLQKEQIKLQQMKNKKQ